MNLLFYEVFEEKFPIEPLDHIGNCEHNVGWFIGNGFNCCVCGYYTEKR